ncbi:nitronate monooxygenase [Nocardioides cynanchi]|uniref:nitronate monooxygenase n=1 Tax=Nocardioides cynanchi TaxID=2558918 RepID=UPI00178136B7|nr:nitronate monooxygenase [Nocardioides cynanchi]
MSGDWPFSGPVLSASGCGGTGRELASYGDLADLGGFVTRSITLHARPGARGERIVESPSGLVNAIGLQNPGVEAFLGEELPALLELGATVVASIAGHSLGEYAEVSRALGRAAGVSALEVNLSAPDASGAGVFDIREPFQAAGVVAACRRDLPGGVLLLAKLRSDASRVVETARAVTEAGADAVVVGNAVPAAMPDGRPGGLSGPAIRPLALRSVSLAVEALPGTPVIACGGIMDPADARAFLDVGARAVQVGSALFHDPTAAHRIAAALAAGGEPR